MVYGVEVTTAAAGQIIRLPKPEQVQIWRKVDSLAEEPRPHGVEKVSGSRDMYRLRVGNHRIVYTVDDRVRVVTVTRVAHRREVYRRL